MKLTRWMAVALAMLIAGLAAWRLHRKAASEGPPPAGAMVEVRTPSGSVWIDAYEDSLDADGRAVDVPGAIPAQVDWYDAKDACAKAGKRLCGADEWVAACAGEGNSAFPYGPAHRDGVCHDADDEREGHPRPAGSMPGCRTPTGIYDLSGNVAEWTGADEGSAALSGSYFSKDIQHTCREKRSTFGPGYRNHTTGFRCCADHRVDGGAAAAVAPEETALEPGRPAPPFTVAGADGKPLDEGLLRGHVTVVSFFASWCAPCRRELPELADLYRALGPQGLQVVAINVDTDEARGRSFAAGLSLPFTVAFDPRSVALGRFGVKSMPTSFLIGPDAVVRERVVGANPRKLQALAERVRAELAPH